MPKGRYEIMRRYMPKVGGYGLDMMFRTCTVQVNLDFESEADMVKKFRVGLALQPVTTALFANSPFREGRPSGFLSYRAPSLDRCRQCPRRACCPGCSRTACRFERYVDYALDVPMYFVYRDGKYIDVAGKSFRDFLARKHPGSGAHRARRISDWADHLTTIFPEVRLKQLPRDARHRWRHVAAHLRHAGAVGRHALRQRRRSMPPGTWSRTGRRRTPGDARRRFREHAFKTPFRRRTVRDLARDMLTISQTGLRNRAREDAIGTTEEGFLQPLLDLVERGYTRAEELLRRWPTEWNGDLARLFTEYNFL